MPLLKEENFLPKIVNMDSNTLQNMNTNIKEEPIIYFQMKTEIIKEEADLCHIHPAFQPRIGNTDSSSFIKINKIKEEPTMDFELKKEIKEEVDLCDIHPAFLPVVENNGSCIVKNVDEIVIKEEPILNFKDLSHIIIKKEVDVSDILPYCGDKCFMCHHCGEEFISFEQMKQHIKEKHPFSNKYTMKFVCHHCGKAFKMFNLLKRHIEKKHRTFLKNLFQGSGFEIKMKKNRKAIQQKTKGRKSKKSDVAKRTNELIPRQIRSMFYYFSGCTSSRGRGNLMCDECDWKSRNSGLLIEHLKTVHNREKPFNCPKCDHSTLRLGDLKRHFVSRHTNEKTFTCSFCAYTTSRSSTLNRHYRAYHSSQTPDVVTYYCPHCPYSSIRRDHLKSHTQYLHHFGKPKNCSHLGCSKENTQSDATILKCDYCEMRTISINSLRMHVKKIHLTQKETPKKIMHTCPFCEYKGKYLPSLRIHIRVKHTGERPYACTFCPSKFADSKVLKRHLRAKHDFS